MARDIWFLVSHFGDQRRECNPSTVTFGGETEAGRNTVSAGEAVASFKNIQSQQLLSSPLKAENSLMGQGASPRQLL